MDCYLGNLGLCKKQTPVPNINKLIEQVAIYCVYSKMDLADKPYNLQWKRTKKNGTTFRLLMLR